MCGIFISIERDVTALDGDNEVSNSGMVVNGNLLGSLLGKTRDAASMVVIQ